MDSKDIMTAVVTGGAALAGVMLSWFLNRLSESAKARQLEKGELGVLVAELYRLHRDIVSFGLQLQMRSSRTREANMADAKGNADMDRITQRLCRNDKLYVALDETKKKIARRRPIAATRLDDVRAALQKLNELEVATKEEFDANFESAMSGFAYSQGDLRDLVLKLACMHGICTWLSVRWEWYRRPPEAGGWAWSPKRR